MYDIVCGMKLRKRSSFKKMFRKKSFHFCSEQCYSEFVLDPEKYVDGTPVIEFRDVYKTFHLGSTSVPVLKGLNLKVWNGDFIALVGASGSGKSTAMYIMGCLDTATKGSVFVDGKKVSNMTEDELAAIRGDKIGFVFQQFNLLAALSSEENIALPLFFSAGERRPDDNKFVSELMRRVGISKRAEHKPLEMSGGEQQRVAIARALVNKPELVLADEPTGNLDSETGRSVMKILKKINEEGGTLVIVTHDPNIAKMAKRIMSLKDGELLQNHQSEKKYLWENNHKK